jgi:mRNA interferase RelE/StbE
VTYTVVLSRQAKRALAEDLPEPVAVACYEFIYGDLARNPFRVGKQLDPPLYPRYSARRGDYRVIYRVENQTVTVRVVTVQHRRDRKSVRVVLGPAGCLRDGGDVGRGDGIGRSLFWRQGLSWGAL